MNQPLRIVVIGLGGIGSWLAPVLARYLEHRSGPRSTVTFVDGDGYERPNEARQNFSGLGNKARRTAEELAGRCERVSFRAVESYVTEANAAGLVQDGAVVFLAVDNHATRKLVSDHCAGLDNVCLLSGGNELTDGNVQVFVRRDGRSLSQPLTSYHPEIASPADLSPADRGCEVLLAEGEPQLIFTNVAVASALLNAFYSVVELDEVEYDEAYLDIRRARMASVRRSLRQE
jgi:molybdopterin/thiamine biosynthesis adenylyltransferase